ncbi:hypothetical protein CC2G_013650 [Coprinopsis cinerea AmutBmut pab1-1]|nr:hypothetical protein CC2G_013650 [Coprinopsis cinerea AmutBmut pab1-1]
MALPVDILYSIFDHLAHDRCTLRAGSIATKVLTAHCQRYLFRSASFDLEVGPIPKFAQALEEKPILGTYVKDFGAIFPGSYVDLHPGDDGRNAIEFLARVLSRLTELESLRLESTYDGERIQEAIHRSESLFSPITSRNLRKIELVGMCIHIPTSGLGRFPKLDTLTLIECRPWTLSMGDPGEMLKIKELVYEGNRAYLDSVVTTLEPSSLRHFHFASNILLDRLMAIELLSRSAMNLTSFTYAVPGWSAGGLHTDDSGFSFFARQNIPVLSSLGALKTFKFQVLGDDLNDDLAYTGTQYTTLPEFIVSSLTSDAVAAIPNLTTLEIRIMSLWNMVLFYRLNKYWKQIEEHLLDHPLPRLQTLRIHLNLSEEWKKQEGFDEGKMYTYTRDAVQLAFGKLERKGIVVEVTTDFDQDYWRRHYSS